MKKLLNSVFFILLVTSSYSQNQLTMPTEIKAVTVYLKGALVTRSGEIQIAQGRQVILIKNLTPSMDAKKHPGKKRKQCRSAFRKTSNRCNRKQRKKQIHRFS